MGNSEKAVWEPRGHCADYPDAMCLQAEKLYRECAYDHGDQGGWSAGQ